MSDTQQPRARRVAGQRAAIRHGRNAPRSAGKNLLAWIGATLSVVLVSTVSVASVAIGDISRSIKPGIELEIEGPPPSLGAIEGEVNILLVGSDSREGQSSAVNEESGSVLNDVNILIHISADHSNATAISIPRDMVVPYAQCPDGGGGWTGPINGLLYEGGLSCVVQTVSNLTGMNIPYAAIVGFDGVVELSSAVGGVEVCLTDPMEDSYTGVTLAAGSHVLSGQEALLFLRSRHGVGDGSDLGRISSQQSFLSSLIRKLKDEGTLTNPVALFSIAKAITSNMTLSTSLNNLDTLVAMALALRDIPLSSVTFVQFPGNTGGAGVYAGKVQPDMAAAALLFDAIRSGQQVALSGDSGRGSVVTNVVAEPTPTPTASEKKSTSSPTPTPTVEPTPETPSVVVQLPSTVSGQTANQVTCAKGRTLDQQ
jgi:LCP family protein required for cell wall assembly